VRLRGLPTPQEWPGVTQLPLYNDFENVIKQNTGKPTPLQDLVKGIDEAGIDLLDRMLQCNPANRISAVQAMAHPFLADVPDAIKQMK